MSLFPMFVKLRDRLCVVVGGGGVAEAKIPGLLEAGAKVRVIAPEATDAISEWAKEGRLDWAPRKFEPGDLSGAFVVIAATSALGVNQDVFHEADAQGILCNAVDDPERCHFYYPAIVRRGQLQIAISTGGFSPALAQRLRRELEAKFGPEYETWLEWLGTIRGVLRASVDHPDDTRKILHLLASNEMFEQFLRAARRNKSNGSVA
ncbi:MAG: bifunctional precorrin-2 dehydrogenase/sirohydrochlorin ferrochelatase [Candidatus Acidiferrales bacterium]|jgi:precorrin-2 dehydrogenase/sirohydrochlorin ferrochelatase